MPPEATLYQRSSLKWANNFRAGADDGAGTGGRHRSRTSVRQSVVPDRFYSAISLKSVLWVRRQCRQRRGGINVRRANNNKAIGRNRNKFFYLFFFLFSSIFSSAVGRYVSTSSGYRITDQFVLYFNINEPCAFVRVHPTRRTKTDFLGAELSAEESHAKCRMSPIRSNMITQVVENTVSSGGSEAGPLARYSSGSTLSTAR